MTNHTKKGVFLIIVTAMLWGTTGTAQALAPPEAPPVAIGAVRLLIGGAALLIINKTRGVTFRNIRWPILPTVFSVLSMAAYNVTFFAGVAKTGVAAGTIVTIGSAPILAGFLGWIVFKEKPGRRWLIATILAVTGGILLIAPGEKLTIEPLGIFLALLSGLSYAVSVLSMKGMVENVPPEAAMALVFTLSAILLSPLLFTQDLSWLSQPLGWGMALHLGLIATATAYVLYARGLKHVRVAKAATLSLAEPLTAGSLGIFLLGERLTTMATGGIFLLLIGLVLVSVENSQEKGLA